MKQPFSLDSLSAQQQQQAQQPYQVPVGYCATRVPQLQRGGAHRRRLWPLYTAGAAAAAVVALWLAWPQPRPMVVAVPQLSIALPVPTLPAATAPHRATTQARGYRQASPAPAAAVATPASPQAYLAMAQLQREVDDLPLEVLASALPDTTLPLADEGVLAGYLADEAELNDLLTLLDY